MIYSNSSRVKSNIEVTLCALCDGDRCRYGLARLEPEELRIKSAIQEKEGEQREDVEKSRPGEEIEAAEKHLASMKAALGTKRKSRWNVEEPTDTRRCHRSLKSPCWD